MLVSGVQQSDSVICICMYVTCIQVYVLSYMYMCSFFVKTKNPRHFSGHSHAGDGVDVTATNGTKFRDHTAKHAVSREALVVLCKEGVGAIEVQRITF